MSCDLTASRQANTSDYLEDADEPPPGSGWDAGQIWSDFEDDNDPVVIKMKQDKVMVYNKMKELGLLGQGLRPEDCLPRDFLVKHGCVLDSCPSLSSSQDSNLNPVDERGTGHDDMNMYVQGMANVRAKAHDSVLKGDATPLQ